jgi:hypothetical protein
MVRYVKIVYATFLAGLFLYCNDADPNNNGPKVLPGYDGRGLLFLDTLLDVDVTTDRRFLARVEPYNPRNPLYKFPIIVHDLTTGQKKAVTERAAFPVFSPDGQWIAYQKLVGYGDLWLVKRDGTSDYPLVQFPGEETPTSWSPDGKRILFHTSPLGSEIWYYDLETGRPYFVFEDTTPYGNIVLAPVWAVSGEEIFFCRETPKGAVISRVNADGTGLVDIWPYDRASYEIELKPAVPDGDRLLVTVTETAETGGDPESLGAPWFLYLKTGQFEQLTYNPNPARINDWAVRLCADGVLVFGSRYLDEDEKTGLYVIKTP